MPCIKKGLGETVGALEQALSTNTGKEFLAFFQKVCILLLLKLYVEAW